MKEWIKNLTGEEIAEIHNWKHLWEKTQTTEEFDQKIFKMIDDYENKRKKKKPILKKFILAAAIFFTFIIIPLFLILYNSKEKNYLFLKKTENNVFFTIQNKITPLNIGDRIKENITIHTEIASICTIQYKKNVSINIYEKSELKVIENKKENISFTLNEGEILINENNHKEMQISFYTENAFIYAVNTEYSVKYEKFDNRTTVKVFEGTVHIETVHERKVIDLKAGEEAIIKGNQLLCKQPDDFKEKKKEWIIRTIYFNPDIKEAITGFDAFEDYIIAVTRHSIVCFTKDEIQWEHTVKNTIITPPTIYNKKVYIPAIDAILCFNLYTGGREPDITTRETMKPGNRILQYNKELYFIFPSGIYLFDNNNQVINKEPFIYIIDAATPVFYNNQIFSTSYLTKNAEAYDLTGKLLWTIPLNDKSSCSPVIVNDFIYTGTNNYTLYKINLAGNIEKQKQLKETIQVIIPGNEQFFYITTGKNSLFTINNQTLNIEKVYDNIKTAFFHNNTLFMGKGDNTIIIIENNTKKEITLINSFVTAFMYHENGYYAGLYNGYILQLIKE
ncbi:MAG: PQQ-binding-like beta-propeller repeat protein [Spirochaetales bacterium]|nr:PQQ-binding-like beta-propeller repeat protein [Spirochaetales bacterium]